MSDDDECWTKPLYDFHVHQIVPEARKWRFKASRYYVKDGILFHKSSSGLAQRFLKKHEQQGVLSHLHDGECSSHIGGRSLAQLAKRQGDFWPTMHEDAASYVAKCDSCQRFANMVHKPSEMLH